MERHDPVAELIFHEEEISGGIEREVARLFAAGRNGACLRQSSFFKIDVKNRDIVESAIGDVKKSTNRNLPLGEKIAWRGPDPAFNAAPDGMCGPRVPLAASN